jgi:hypothetical protein
MRGEGGGQERKRRESASAPIFAKLITTYHIDTMKYPGPT